MIVGVVPPTLAARRARARREIALAVAGVVLAGMVLPVLLVLVPLLATRAWRRGAREVASASVIVGSVVVWCSVDLLAIVAWPSILAGPWLVALLGTLAWSVAWTVERPRDARATACVMAGLLLLAAPWSPLYALLLALACLAGAPMRRSPVAANDNAPLARSPTARLYPLPPSLPHVSYPALRSARPATSD